MEWYYTVLIAILVIFVIGAVIAYTFRKRIFNWVMASIFGIYIATPLDLLPDFIPLAGWVDDLVAFILMAGFIYRGVKSIRNKKIEREVKS
ncbi:MAG: hypothetical protein APG12_00132 [Candidatus Methanofastidiosum methylothiophilum]|uniref:DUF1232 domain-containing protein n=1 Tax=Candidatus Methanofastidiosum methylothiophilum TaxID=1705564 RepID=A0A150IKC8_9EURY|nr:MAG: hypothetical protein APG10_00826 [Candidatus Methanofastidiosum methylthiophilus]KYC47189.1 MAG: hypothetical protein APG11_01345 [Candidatus Methanofastidiosum methylthiophilus]KYC51468.1 MAG: hypothetical protein APG12_00132 [Candidatus Methanofastidiosum methylthiophilus]